MYLSSFSFRTLVYLWDVNEISRVYLKCTGCGCDSVHCWSVCPFVLFSFGLLPPCLKEKNSWVCGVGLKPAHSEQQVLEACFCRRHSQQHTVAAAVGGHSLKSIHHMHTDSPQQEAAAHASLQCSSFVHGLMDASSWEFFCSDLKLYGVEKPAEASSRAGDES